MIDTAIILAAGRGQRMGELTVGVPKPLLRVADKPLMQYCLELLIAHGVKRIGINLHHHADAISGYFGNGASFGVAIEYVREERLTGTAGGVHAVAGVLKPTTDFFVVAADMLVNFDLSAMAAAHRARSALASLACYFRPRDQLGKSGVILFDKETFEIKKFVERPKHDEEIVSQWVNSSVYCFSPGILRYLADAQAKSSDIDLARDIFPAMLSGTDPIYAYPFGEEFYQLGIDTPDRIQRAEQDIAAGLFMPYRK